MSCCLKAKVPDERSLLKRQRTEPGERSCAAHENGQMRKPATQISSAKGFEVCKDGFVCEGLQL